MRAAAAFKVLVSSGEGMLGLSVPMDGYSKLEVGNVKLEAGRRVFSRGDCSMRKRERQRALGCVQGCRAPRPS